MEIRSFKHKGLKALHQSDKPRNTKGLPPDLTKKLHNQLTAIEAVKNIRELVDMGLWRVHELTPKYPKKWSMWVSGNYRLTFYLNDDQSVSDVNLEDYH